ncbi:MAG: glycine zipper 2TM domain-containing protein [Blastomonas sp.]
MKKTMMIIAAAALAAPVPVLADPPGHAPAWGYHKKDKRAYSQGYRDGRRDAQRISADTRIWRGRDGRYYCKRDDGTTGLLIGAAAGAVIGAEVAGRGDRTLGALLGGVGGAILGREIDRGDYRCR